MSTLKVGDLVRIGRGKSTWKVTGFGEFANGQPHVDLEAVDGYARQAVEPGRVTRVEESS